MLPGLRIMAAPVLFWALAIGSAPARAQPLLPLDAFYGLLNQNEAAAQSSLKLIHAGWRKEYAALLLEVLGFVPSRETRLGILSLLEQASGGPIGGRLDPSDEWLWSSEHLVHPDYAEFKAGLYEQIDPRFREYFANRPKTLIRLDEIRWTTFCRRVSARG